MERHHPIWFIFGVHDDGRVDIARADNDVLVRVPREQAEKIVELHNQLVTLIEDVVREHKDCIPFGA